MSDWKIDERPQHRGWAPGEYVCKCRKCDCEFIGDKRATMCADCAYTLPGVPKKPADPEPNGLQLLTEFEQKLCAELQDRYCPDVGCSFGIPEQETAAARKKLVAYIKKLEAK